MNNNTDSINKVAKAKIKILKHDTNSWKKNGGHLNTPSSK